MPYVIIHSYASAHACGGHTLCVDTQEFGLYFIALSSIESQTGSNFRELVAILYSLQSFKAKVKGKVVKYFIDNQNVATITSKGSTSLGLHSLALKNFQFCLDNNISMEVEWVPRSLNTFADSISRIVDYDDWALTTDFFQSISKIAGPFTVECLTSQCTAQCKKILFKVLVPRLTWSRCFQF